MSEDLVDQKEDSTEKETRKRKESGVVEAETVERYRIVFDNANNNDEIKSSLSNLGYGEDKMSEGKILYDLFKQSIETCSKKRKSYVVCREFWNSKYNILHKEFKRHRSLAKVLFHKTTSEFVKLELNKPLSKQYTQSMYTISRFYSTIVEDQSLISAFATMNILDAELQKGGEDIREVELARSAVLNASGLSQDETQKKAQAKIDIEEWMTNFFKVARIALEEEPQLLESLGIVVKS